MRPKTILPPPILTRIQEKEGSECERNDLIDDYEEYADWRQATADKFERYCRTGSPDYLDEARSVATALVKDPRSERILLYLPFSLLKGASGEFKQAYLATWRKLLRVEDVRENFHEGDVFELDARPASGLEYVVKAAHLTPWLLINDLIDEREWLKILRDNCKNVLLLQGFREAFEVLLVSRMINPAYIGEIAGCLVTLSRRKKVWPLYISKQREKWLTERTQPLKPLLTPGVWLGDPFNDEKLNAYLWPLFEKISERLAPGKIVLVGGSQVKGYGTVGSDLDVWDYEKLQQEGWSRLGNPEAAHIYLNSFWVGEAASETRRKAYRQYKDQARYSKNARQTVEKLEQDLCLYRLLHKGFGRFVGKRNSDFLDSRDKLETLAIDGDCPFYDEEYRRVATMLYARYAWI